MPGWETVVERLRSAGLGTYEAKVLAFLSAGGPATGTILSRKAGVPHGRIYSVLQALEEQGLVEGDDARPRVYSAAPPSIIATRLVRNARAKADSTIAQVERAAREATRSLRESGSRDTTRPLFHAAVGEERARDELIRILHEASTTAVALLDLGQVRGEDLAIGEALVEACRRGVHVRVLVPRDQAVEAALHPDGANLLPDFLDVIDRQLEARLLERPLTPFGVADGEVVALGVQNPLEPGTYFALLRIQDHRLAQALTERFQALWTQADAVTGLLEKLEQ